MGKGDKKSRKGKIFMGTYGNTRPRKTETEVIIPKKKKAEPMKATTASKKTVANKKPTTKKKD